MFLVPQVSSEFWNELLFETLYQFSSSSLEIRGFSSSYQILLGLFDILNAFYDNIWVNIEAKNMSNGVNNSNIIMKCA